MNWRLTFLLMVLILVPVPEARSESEKIQWNAHSNFADGRQLLTDGGLIIDSRFVTGAGVPLKSIPEANVQRLLQSNTDHEFGLNDLKESGGHFMAPGPIQLNRKYVELLRNSPLKSSLRFRAKGSMDPILILDGSNIVGVVMPMKL